MHQWTTQNCPAKSSGWMFSIIFFMLLVAPLMSRSEEHVKLICNPDAAITDLSAREVINIFLGRKRTLPNGQVILLAILDSGPASRAFLNERVGKSERQFFRHWRNLVFSGEGLVPKIFNSEKALIAYVSSTKGAIGYISNTNLVKYNDVNIITILKEEGR